MDLDRLQELACSGDRDAQAELIRRFYPRVQRMVHRELERDFRRQHRWLLPLFSTGDIVQEVFTGVIQSLDTFRAEDDDAFVKYLSTLVKHRLVDAVRHHEAGRRDARRQVAPPTSVGPGAGDDPTPSLAASISEQLRAFREVLDAFPERERRLLELRLVEKEPFADLADKLAFPSSDAARKAFNQAQARLVVKLRSRGIHPPTIS
ncbi:MAG: sigma-70 family RNA polymerase sigma factor [Planctomycetes bacterium]|nr:sigma-70 family RNA polymerase sigma factor [Planctomycetota bacterium]